MGGSVRFPGKVQGIPQRSALAKPILSCTRRRRFSDKRSAEKTDRERRKNGLRTPLQGRKISEGCVKEARPSLFIYLIIYIGKRPLRLRTTDFTDKRKSISHKVQNHHIGNAENSTTEYRSIPPTEKRAQPKKPAQQLLPRKRPATAGVHNHMITAEQWALQEYAPCLTTELGKKAKEQWKYTPNSGLKNTSHTDAPTKGKRTEGIHNAITATTLYSGAENAARCMCKRTALR